MTTTALLMAIALAAPCCIAIPLMPSGGLAVGVLGVGLFFYSMCLALPPMAIQAMAPNQMRGQLVGTLHLLSGLLGFGVGPVLAGSISDTIGSLPTALAFELLRRFFRLYLEAFPAMSLVYGGFALAILFMVSIQVSWLLVLLGAEVAYAVQHFPQIEAAAALPPPAPADEIKPEAET